jgi:putative aldouronate transport system permease protein
MAIGRTVGGRIFDRANELLMLLLAFAAFYPLYHVLAASVSDGLRLMGHRGLLLRPLGFSLAAYRYILRNDAILVGYRNTIVVVVGGTALNLVLTSLGAYFLSRRRILLQKPIMLAILFTMFFQGGMIPSFLNVRALGLFDSLWALILPAGISTYNLIVMRTSFRAIPESLEESAFIDGANELQTLLRILLPLSKPVIAVMVLYYGVAHWNSWFSALVYLHNRRLFPLQMILREMLIYGSENREAVGSGSGDIMAVGETIRYAIIVVATLPILSVYPFLQKYFTKGVMIGAVKG